MSNKSLDFPIIMDEFYDLFPLSNAGIRQSSYLIYEGLDWQMFKRFNDRFDIRVGGNVLIVTQSFDKATGEIISSFNNDLSFDEFSNIRKQSQPPVIIDWDNKGRELSLGQAKKEGLKDIVCFLENRIKEHDAHLVCRKPYPN